MSQTATYDHLQHLVDQIRQRSAVTPRLALLLGTGLGAVADRLEIDVRIPYSELDGMPRTTAESHAGEVILGTLQGMPAVAFSGRLHCYEGHSPQDVVVPVRVARLLGAEFLLMGSAVGGMNPAYAAGDVVVISDHINLMGLNPLVGPNDDRIGPRWPDMIEPYDHRLIRLAHEAALENRVRLQEAVYAAVTGPCLETRAEYRMLRGMGADVVGMSTVPEAIAAVHCGLRTLVFAIITDRCLPDALEPVDIPAIIAAANRAEPTIGSLVDGVVRRLD
jgi:purine-nucleoside phosphorylase